MSDYYKSLISDDEVIRELIKESQEREGILTEACRLKPNLNFFQRTVNNLVSNNSRIDKCIDTFKAVHVKDRKSSKSKTPVYNYTPTKKPLINYAFERQLVLQTKRNFIKSGEEKQKIFTEIKGPNAKMRRKNVPDANSKTSIKNFSKDKEEVNFRRATLMHIIDSLSTDSEDSNNSDTIEFINDYVKKTTCNSINTYKHEKLRKNQGNVSAECEEVISISSDDSSNCLAYKERACKRMKTKVKEKEDKSKLHIHRKDKLIFKIKKSRSSNLISK